MSTGDYSPVYEKHIVPNVGHFYNNNVSENYNYENSLSEQSQYSFKNMSNYYKDSQIWPHNSNTLTGNFGHFNYYHPKCESSLMKEDRSLKSDHFIQNIIKGKTSENIVGVFPTSAGSNMSPLRALLTHQDKNIKYSPDFYHKLYRSTKKCQLEEETSSFKIDKPLTEMCTLTQSNQEYFCNDHSQQLENYFENSCKSVQFIKSASIEQEDDCKVGRNVELCSPLSSSSSSIGTNNMYFPFHSVNNGGELPEWTQNTRLNEFKDHKAGRRTRHAYSQQQTLELELSFNTASYLTRAQRISLANKLNLSERQIKIWFQNRRMKAKKIKDRVSQTFQGSPCLDARQTISQPYDVSCSQNIKPESENLRNLERSTNTELFQQSIFPKESLASQYSSLPVASNHIHYNDFIERDGTWYNNQKYYTMQEQHPPPYLTGCIPNSTQSTISPSTCFGNSAFPHNQIITDVFAT